MDSPDIKSSLHGSILKETGRGDDSGYVTNTPLSAECTLSSDLSANSFLHISQISTPANTSCGSRDISHKPKSLFKNKDAFVEDSFTEALPTLYERDIAECLEVEKTSRPTLKRQLALDEDCCESLGSSHQQNDAIFSPGLETESCVTKLKDLAVEDDRKVNFCSIENIAASSRCITKRRANSDPSGYNRSLLSLNYCLSDANQKVKLDLNTPHTLQDVKNVCTPVKGTKKLKRSVPDELSDRASMTPDRQEVCISADCHMSEHKFVKKLVFEPQPKKLGSPEKYQLLYPTLKPVTPPKKSKLVKSESPKCRKKLHMQQQKLCYVGREHIDFLRLLQPQLPAIALILSHLSGDDLISVCNVSKSWSAVCRSDKAADKRRHRAVLHNERIKENKMCTTFDSKAKDKLLVTSQSVNLTRRDHLNQIQSQMNIMDGPPPKSRSPPVSPRRRRFNMYVKAASEDPTVKLRSCPQCRRPAKVYGYWATCSGPTCMHKFCSKCFGKKIPGAICCQLEAPSPSKQSPSSHGILSKKSRRNLRRL